MTALLIRLFATNPDHTPKARSAFATLGSATGICCNILLFLAKLLIGLVTGSISVMADAVNNLSDMGSSLVTLLGYKLSEKPADKEHPFGHGRIEYMSGFLVSVAIIIVGFELAKTSIGKIIHPEEVTFSAAMVIVLGLSVLVKLWMFVFYRKIGKRINSTTMFAAAMDSLSDVVSTSAVLAAAVISRLSGLNLDAYMGVAVAAFILISGFKIAKSTLDPLLGQPPSPEFVQELERRILSYKGILGIHDLIVHNYGPGRCFVSVHAEVSADEDILVSHDRIDLCEREVGEQMNIEMVIHMDPILVNDEQIDIAHALVHGVLLRIDPRLTMHDFRMVKGDTHTNLIFDVVAPPDCPSAAALKEQIEQEVKKIDERYFCVINVDKSFVL